MLVQRNDYKSSPFEGEECGNFLPRSTLKYMRCLCGSDRNLTDDNYARAVQLKIIVMYLDVCAGLSFNYCQ